MDVVFVSRLLAAGSPVMSARAQSNFVYAVDLNPSNDLTDANGVLHHNNCSIKSTMPLLYEHISHIRPFRTAT